MANTSIDSFIARWMGVSGTERANYQLFIADLCALLEVPPPQPATDDQRDNAYVFERRVTQKQGTGEESAGFIDCYRRGAFVLEAKKLKRAVETRGFDGALLKARTQAENYARSLPAGEGRPPFVVVVDVGNVIELYAEFTRSGATYTPFPDPTSHRITLDDLRTDAIRNRLRKVWLEPLELDPARASAAVTREVAKELAEVAKSLEKDGHGAETVAGFLTRCLFSMFAEDVELLPKGSFLEVLTKHRDEPETLQNMLRILWGDMDRGGFSAALATKVRKFNGKLFKSPNADGYALPLKREQIEGLLRAAKANWREVEPAIFGTLLERALDPVERHALGAHYTPRAYVERLVLPTVVEPLRADWADAQAAAMLLLQEAEELEGKARDGKRKEARAEIERFYHQLCHTRVLDPACGSGNFLYVTLEHLKRLEGEVLNVLHGLSAEGGVQRRLQSIEGETVSVAQLRGIEINPRAAALAELVLWIGFLQWHIRTRGKADVPEPVVQDFENIECRDAVLAYDREEVAMDPETGRIPSRWDGQTFKAHSVTGELVPDESAQVPEMRYVNAHRATWPNADYVVGNPPFIGASAIRESLGDGYASALRSAWDDVPESADYVAYWWHAAAILVRSGAIRQFGFITTNSIRQTFNRRVIEQHLDANDPIHLQFAIPDHPWVDAAHGAAVRIAMTVASKGPPGGRLLNSQREVSGQEGEVAVEFAEANGNIHADLRIGADVARTRELLSNRGLASPGVKLHGSGFIVTEDEARDLGLGRIDGLERIIRQYRNGKDIAKKSRGVRVIDLFGLTEKQVRTRCPEVYQWVYERVKPERDMNNRATYRENWWTFGEARPELRKSMLGLDRYIATGETARHRYFVVLPAEVLPDNMLIAIALDDPHSLGVLSSTIHVEWALATGGRLGVGNDPRYNKSRCFDTFPFPEKSSPDGGPCAQKIGRTAAAISELRSEQLALHDMLALTDIYGVLDRVRRGFALTAKDKAVHRAGLVEVLRQLHDELDAAVLEAYGWSDLGPVPWSDNAKRQAWTDELLNRLVALNAKRAAEEQAFLEGKPGGVIRWLRPEYQDPARRCKEPTKRETQGEMDLGEAVSAKSKKSVKGKVKSSASTEKRAWPATLPEQLRSVSDVLATARAPLSLDAIADYFTGRGPWKRKLPQILTTLEAVGRARLSDGKATLL